MSVAVKDPESIADLLERLGDIDPNRVRLRPAPGQAVEEDVVAIRNRERRIYELVDGVLVEKIMGFRESILAGVVIRMLGAYVRSANLGVVAGPDGMMRLAPGLVRIPDVSFIAWSRFPNGVVPEAPIPDLAPDLAVEILSVGNTRREMIRKVAEYFSAGVRLVWLIEPAHKTAEVYTGPTESVTLEEQDRLDGGDVVPGFELMLSDLFAELNG
jgi:Uma2 family endonuclease